MWSYRSIEEKGEKMNSKRHKRFLAAIVSVFILMLAPLALAELIDRGNGIIDDTDANRMWVLYGYGAGYGWPFPGGADYSANNWVQGLNDSGFGTFNDWRLPTVDLQANGIPTANSGDLFTLYSAMPSDRNSWPFLLGGDSNYAYRYIYTDQAYPIMNGLEYWGFNFQTGQYVEINVSYWYGWVGVMAVRTYADGGNGGDGGNGTAPVPEPTTLVLLGAGLIGLAGYGRKKLN